MKRTIALSDLVQLAKNLPLFLPLTMLLIMSFTDGIFYHPYPFFLVATLAAMIVGNITASDH